jgi:D-lactate dehydrogenase (cytochrome)
MQRYLLHSILRTQATGFAPRVSRKCLQFSVRNSSTQAAGRSFNSILVFASSIVSGLGGYYISQTWPSISTFGSVEPRYGTAKDFNKAINELRVEFGEDGISTDPDILDPYGYSMNDYHPGSACVF